MVQVEDLEKTAEPDEPCKAEKPTLLSKYQIPVQHLEFDYIEKCQNGRELEKILHILKSGQEGYFPDLIKTTKQRLSEIKPNSKLLRKICPVLNKIDVNENEWNNLSRDLAGWVKDVNKKDQELVERKIKFDEYHSDSSIRKPKQECVNLEVPSNPKRIASTDYDSWDKYDPDTEMLKMDLEDEKLKKEALKEHTANLKKSKSVRFNNFATEAEAVFEANQEKERGNESFKAGEYQGALQHYTNSLECKPLAVVYTNRALVYSKLKKYTKTIEDCKAALKLEPDNFKAHLRLAQNYDVLKEYDKALKSVENAIAIDPNNMVAQQTANKIHKACGKTNSKTRLMIEDIQSNSGILKNITNERENQNKSDIEFNVDTTNISKSKPSKSILKSNKNSVIVDEKLSKSNLKSRRENLPRDKSEGYEIIAIPGTSKMAPPYYKVIYSKDPYIIRKEKQKILCRPTLLHMTTIDVASDDEYQKGYDYIKSTENSAQNYKVKKKEKRSTSIKIKDDLESFQLENFKFDDDDETAKESHKNIWSSIHKEKIVHTTAKSETIVNKGAGGEPHNIAQDFVIPSAEDLREPYVFIQVWNAIRKDSSYAQHAELLRKMDLNRMSNVIGYKLDDAMLSAIIKCLYNHFMVPGELDRLHSALVNITQIPRLKMTLMFLEDSDWTHIFQLIQFLDQHGRSLPDSVKAIYCNK